MKSSCKWIILGTATWSAFVALEAGVILGAASVPKLTPAAQRLQRLIDEAHLNRLEKRSQGARHEQ